VMAESSISDGERLIAKLAGQPTNEHLERLRGSVQSLKSALGSASIKEIETLRQGLEQSLSQCMRAGVR